MSSEDPTKARSEAPPDKGGKKGLAVIWVGVGSFLTGVLFAGMHQMAEIGRNFDAPINGTQETLDLFIFGIVFAIAGMAIYAVIMRLRQQRTR